jgi:serine/threonine-protein kinase
MQPPVYAAYPQAGEVIDGKYQIEKMLGEGGMGAVAKAIHLLRRAPVALKFMSPMFVTFEGAVPRFLQEAQAASQIISDHVVQIYDVGKLPSGAPYMVMEYMEGKDLADLLQQEGTPGLPVDRAIHFTLQILRALQVAHAQQIVHRDLKPSNCFVITKDGERDFIKLLDFGISKVQQPGGGSLTQTGSALGTPLYMSPEQAKSPKDVDSRSDIYSVAVILFELLTGRTPFFSESGEFTEILFKLFTADPPNVKELRPDLPEGLAEAIHHAMARERDHRTPTVVAFADELAPFAAAHSQAILQRLHTHVAIKSHLPAIDMPPSALAFERLGSATGHGGAGATGSSGRMPVASVTGGTVHITPPSLSPPPQSAFPPSPEARARPEDAAAKTQLPHELSMQIPKPPPVPAMPGVRTDMASSREAPMPVAPSKGGAKLAVPIGLGILAVLGVGAVVAVKVLPHDKATGMTQPTAEISATPEAGRSAGANSTTTAANPVKSAEPVVENLTGDAAATSQPFANPTRSAPPHTATTPATNTQPTNTTPPPKGTCEGPAAASNPNCFGIH